MTFDPQKSSALMIKIQTLAQEENLGVHGTMVALISAIVWLISLNCTTKQEADRFLLMARKDLFNGVKSLWPKSQQIRETLRAQLSGSEDKVGH